MPLSPEQQKLLESNFGATNNLGASVDFASRKTPQQFAEDKALAEDSLLPIDVVERNRDEVKRRKKLESLELDKLKSLHPSTAQYLSNPHNAAVSIDDIENLKGLESALKRPTRGFFNNAARGALERVNNLTGNLIEFAGNIGEDVDAYMDSLGIPNPGIVINDDGISWSWDIPNTTPNLVKEVGKGISAGGEYDYKPQFTWENFKGDMTPTNLAGFAIEQGIRSLPDMAAAMYTLGPYLLSRTEEIAEDRVANNGTGDVTTADLKTAMGPAVAVVLLERLGAQLTFGVGGVSTVKGVAKATAGATLGEGATEFLQEGVEYLGGTLGTNKDVSMTEMLDQQLAGFAAGGIMGGGIRGTTASTEALIKKTRRTVNTRAASVEEQSAIDDILTYHQLSQTRELSPKQFKEFLDGIDIDQSFYLDKEAVSSAIPEGTEIPASILDQLMDGAETDIRLDRNQFIDDIASNDDLLAALRPHLRLSSDTLTQAELTKDYELEAQALIERAQAEKDEISDVQKVFDEVKDQLVETGRMNEATARVSAAPLVSYFNNKAKALGVSAQELFETVGLKIKGPESPDVLAPSTDAEIMTAPPLDLAQNFSDVKIEETAVIAETGQRVKIKQDVQKTWEQTAKRRNTVEELIKCLRN